MNFRISTMKLDDSRAEKIKQSRFAIFRLGANEFAVDVAGIKEIIKAQNITTIPDPPRFVKGIVNLRGKVVVALDLKARFFLDSDDAVTGKHIMITRNSRNYFGLIVDEVAEIRKIQDSIIQDAPHFVAKIHEEYVRGVVNLDGRLIIVLYLDRVLNENELIRLSEIQRDHAPLDG